MEAKIYVRNLAKSTSQEDLNTFITMSAQSEADKAISMFNAYSMGELELKVNLAKPREQRGFDTKN